MSASEEPAMVESTPTDPQANAGPAVNAEDLPAKLDQLKASATQQYSLKNYSAAAEFYSEAAEVQDQINGEMSTENADLLYQYGRCLYHVAVSKSDVLGGKVASTSEEPKRKKRKVNAQVGATSGEGSSNGRVISDALQDGEQKVAEEVVEAVVDEKDGVRQESKRGGEPTVASKPFFQITGDENWTDSEEEDEDEDAADAEAEEEEDDFAIAYEILDVARVLLTRKLEASSNAEEARQIKERLADAHDLQAEISLENERFAEAIKDTRDALAFKLELYPQESSLIAEAHFKLSLALEFASVTSTTEEGPADSSAQEESKATQIDEQMRAEAATEMEKAIASCTARIAKEESTLHTLTAIPTKYQDQQRSITDVKEMVADMQQRLIDLRSPAVSLAGITGPAGAPDGSDPIRGILGDMLGESKAAQQKRIQEATAGANDLSGLVKHRKKSKIEDAPAVVDGRGKRKLDEGVVLDGTNGNGKRVKFAEVEDEVE